MIWKRLRKSTPEEEEKFKDMMTDEKVPFTDRLIMIITAFFVLVIPAALVLIGMSLLVMLLFGAL